MNVVFVGNRAICLCNLTYSQFD